jgi:hypothetical protein
VCKLIERLVDFIFLPFIFATSLLAAAAVFIYFSVNNYLDSRMNEVYLDPH